MQVGCCNLESLGCSSGRYGRSLGKKAIKMDLDLGLISNLETSCPHDKQYQRVEIEWVSSLNPELPYNLEAEVRWYSLASHH
ncbi:hypothetical protein WN944_007195 [Citrus x changshan-huyou]|uniref:Uncharacterized protein n=1 Tax=Citrus x changshan-huyou TaxID=2935761 RepID=A0AAP0QXU4_9ROSI